MTTTSTVKFATPSDREIVLTRVFDAPRARVFDAWTRPELLGRWFLPRGWSLVVCEVDLRVGGAWRFVVRGPDGTDMETGGVYREVVPPERFVHTQWFSRRRGIIGAGESLATAVLVEQDGKTMLSTTVLYPLQEVRDAVLNSGMEHGVAASYDRLGELLASSSRGRA